MSRRATSAACTSSAQRRGFDHFGYTEDPKLHAMVLDIQKDLLDHVMHPVVLQRITDTQSYGNDYSVVEMLGDLTAAVFSADLGGDVSSFRQNLQIEYVRRLLDIVDKQAGARYDNVARGVALDRLRWVEGQMTRNRGGDAATAAHRAHILYRIERGLDEPDA